MILIEKIVAECLIKTASTAYFDMDVLPKECDSNLLLTTVEYSSLLLTGSVVTGEPSGLSAN